MSEMHACVLLSYVVRIMRKMAFEECTSSASELRSVLQVWARIAASATATNHLQLRDELHELGVEHKSVLDTVHADLVIDGNVQVVVNGAAAAYQQQRPIQGGMSMGLARPPPPAADATMQAAAAPPSPSGAARAHPPAACAAPRARRASRG